MPAGQAASTTLRKLNAQHSPILLLKQVKIWNTIDTYVPKTVLTQNMCIGTLEYHI